MPETAGYLDLGKRVVAAVSEKNVTLLAAGIAYHAFVSLVPLLILLLLAVSVVGGRFEERLLGAAQASLPAPIAEVVAGVFATDSATSVSIVGLLVLVWGTLKILRGVDAAFTAIYNSEAANSIADQIVDGLVVLAALLASIVATVVVSAAFAAFAARIPFLGIVTPLVLLGGLVLAFLPMYYRFPDVDLEWREVIPGVLLAAFGWAALQGLFQVYLVVGGGGVRGFFGGVIVVVIWLYFSSLVLLLGAVLNAVIGGYASTPSAGAAGETTTVRRIDREELAEYLRDVRRELTGHYAEVDPNVESTDQYQRLGRREEVTQLAGTVRTYRPIELPDDEVEVVERVEPDGDGQVKSITLRWRAGPGGE